jgi:transcriptional regulator with XRE-family HTH domain
VKDRIKQLRKELGLTQQEFADKLGVKRNTVAMYEMGKTTPSEAVIISICREFNVNEEWLREGIGETHIQLTKKDELIIWATTALSGESENFRNRFVDALSKLDVDDWELLANMAETLVKQKEKD